MFGFKTEVEKIPPREHALLGPAILALTDIISEPYPAYSVIPARCKATYDRRLLTDETPESVLGEITSLPALKDANFTAKIAESDHKTYTGESLHAKKFFPAWELDENNDLVQMALKGLRASGLDPKFSTYRFCTNAAYRASRTFPPLDLVPVRKAMRMWSMNDSASTISKRPRADTAASLKRCWQGK